MSSYPSLHPSGFVDFENDIVPGSKGDNVPQATNVKCSGPILYRSQPSRETPGITQLNEVIEKYAVGQYKGGDFMRLASNLKNTSRMWNRLPREAKSDFLKLIIESNSDLSKDIIDMYCPKVADNNIEHFGQSNEQNEEQVEDVSKMNNNKLSIFIITIVAIVSIIIGFLISTISN